MHLSIHAPQYIYLGLQAVATLSAVALHGTPTKINGAARAFGLTFVTLPLLYWGGFFG